MAIDYPLTLPMPQASTVTPLERRALSDAEAPRDARALSRDKTKLERLVWPPLSPTQAAEFYLWWKDDLTYGGAWFNATWPLPEGTVDAVHKFLEQPTWTLIPGGFWRIEALCEVMGRGNRAAAAPSASSAIGWFDPVSSPGGAVAHSNSGAGPTAGAGSIPSLYAGLVGWTSEVLVWSIASWSGTVGEEPFIADSADGWVQIQWNNVGGWDPGFPYVYDASLGTIVLTATINGVPISVGQRLEASAVPPTGDYPTYAWGPE